MTSNLFNREWNLLDFLLARLSLIQCYNEGTKYQHLIVTDSLLSVLSHVGAQTKEFGINILGVS